MLKKSNFLNLLHILILLSATSYLMPMALAKETDKKLVFTPTKTDNITPKLSFSKAVKVANNSVVSIYTAKEFELYTHPFYNDPFFRHFFRIDPSMQQNNFTQKRYSMGSGVIVTTNGYILTNYHVIRDATEIEVQLPDNRKTTASVVGIDPESDLAVLKIDLPNLSAIPIGNSDSLEVGDIVLAIGNPFDIGQTVTQGIVSGVSRNNFGSVPVENYIQTDASINFGNSGGALIDTNGNLLGINTAIKSFSGGSVGVNFAIPINMAKTILEQLVTQGHVTRGYFGIVLGHLNNDIRKELNYKEGNGAIVTNVFHNSPAYKAGIKPNDIITHINNKAVTDEKSAFNLIATLEPKKSYVITVIRNNVTQDLRIVAENRYKQVDM